MSAIALEPLVLPAEWQLEFMDRVGAWADVSGLPPSYVRVFAWLLVCDPPEQSVDDLRRALGLSAGAVSMATVALVRTGLLERLTRPGGRRLYFRFHPAGWERMLRLRLEATSQIRVAAEDALFHAGRSQRRLARMRDLYAYFERSIADLLQDHAPTTGTGTQRAAGARRPRTRRGAGRGSSPDQISK